MPSSSLLSNLPNGPVLRAEAVGWYVFGEGQRRYKTYFWNHILWQLKFFRGCSLCTKKRFPAIRCTPPSKQTSNAGEAMESDMFGGRGGEISECVFWNNNWWKFEDLRAYNLQKGYTAICCIPNPPDGFLARAKTVGRNTFDRAGGERWVTFCFGITICKKKISRF